MPLKKLGINMNMPTWRHSHSLKAYKNHGKEMNPGEQVMLRYNYLMAVYKRLRVTLLEMQKLGTQH